MQYMMNFQNMLTTVASKIFSEHFNCYNWVVLGDNSTGKSELLKNLVSSSADSMYYIDSVNRRFVVSETSLLSDTIELIEPISIIRQRIEDKIFNLEDTFGVEERIWRYYPIYKEKLRTLVKDFINVEFDIKRINLGDGYGESDPMAFIDNTPMSLSSGYQAIIRIFSEIIYFCDVFAKKGTVVIDEIDEFLSPKYSSSILNFLTEQYPDIRFIVSTHSNDLVASSINCRLIVLNRSNYEILNGDDFNSTTSVGTLFEKLFISEVTSQYNMIDTELQKLFNLKILGAWTLQEDMELESINFEHLSNIQKIIYKQIKEW